MSTRTNVWTRLGVRATALVVCAGAIAAAQSATPAPEPVRDNSFLVEEAFNQPAGVVQHVGMLDAPSKGGMSFTFSDEWPIRGMRHQLSYSIRVQRAAIRDLIGMRDVGVHYRYQLLGTAGGRRYIAPRISMLLPTGDAGGATLEFMTPATLELSTVSFNANLGGSITPRARIGGNLVSTSAIKAGGSVMWAATRSFNLLLESMWRREISVAGNPLFTVAQEFTIAPGFRWAQDLARNVQLVRGVAFSITHGPDGTNRAAVFYLSVEHPFTR